MDANLKQLIDKYRGTNWTNLLRTDRGNYHLKESKGDLDFIKTLIDSILDSPFFESSYINYQNQLMNALAIFDQMRNAIVHYENDSQREQMIIDIRSWRFNIFSELQPLYNMIQFQSRDPKTSESYMSEMMKELKRLDKSAQELKKQQSQIAGQSTEKEASRYGDFFNSEAEENKKYSVRWLWVIILTTVALSFLAYFILKVDPSITYNNIPELIIKGNLISKFFIFTIALLFLTMARRNYLSLRHQFTVNRLRQNALYSHKEVLTSIQKTENKSDKEISNAILLELTKAMFAHQDTGYVKEGGRSHSQITEIQKALFNNSSDQ